LALTSSASLALIPMTSSISWMARSGWPKADRSCEHGHDFDVLLDRGIAVRHRLRLHALARIHHEQGALACCERARDFIGEIDVPGRIDQVEVVGPAVSRGVLQRGGLGLDRDAALALEIHGVEDLFRHLAFSQAAAALDETVGQGRLAVVDVRDDRKIADMLHSGLRKRVPLGTLVARCKTLNFSGSRRDMLYPGGAASPSP